MPPADGLGYAAYGRVVARVETVEAIQHSVTLEGAPTVLSRGRLIAQPVVIFAAHRIEPGEVLPRLHHG